MQYNKDSKPPGYQNNKKEPKYWSIGRLAVSSAAMATAGVLVYIALYLPCKHQKHSDCSPGGIVAILSESIHKEMTEIINKKLQ